MPVDVLPARIPFNIIEVQPENLFAAKVYGEMQLSQSFTVTASYRQDLLDSRFNLSQTGISYQMTPEQRAYIREEYGNYETLSELRTIVGIESALGKNMTGFSEYRFSNGAGGERNMNSLGLKKRFYPMEAMSLLFTLESLRTLDGKKQLNEPDILSATGAVDYQKNGYRLSAKLEYRDEKGLSTAQNSYLAETLYCMKFNPEYSLLLRERFMFSDMKGTGERITSRTVLGLAYRPVSHDWFNGLARIEYKKDKDTMSSLKAGSDAYILSSEGIIQVTSRLQVAVKFASKLVKDCQANSLTNMAATRIILDLTKRIDLAGEYRAMSNNLQNGFASGGTAELGMRIKDNLWVSAGYTFDRFDTELKGDDATSQGPFIRMRVKFDEKSLTKIAKSAMFMQ
jgi:hypothetical protein